MQIAAAEQGAQRGLLVHGRGSFAADRGLAGSAKS
jgi:hypothetical protein